MPHFAYALDHCEEVQNYPPRRLHKYAYWSLSMHYGIAGRFSDRVDVQVAILDYPDDHYTARWAQK